MDETLLLIEPVTAASYVETTKDTEKAKPEYTLQPRDSDEKPSVEGTEPPRFAPEKDSGKQVKRQFYGSIELDPVRAKLAFADIVDEVVMQFTSRPDVKVRIAIEIQTESAVGFDDVLQRAVKENCNVLKFINAEFE